jgi:hypothetical protein
VLVSSKFALAMSSSSSRDPLRRLVVDVLLPAYNAFEREQSEALRKAISANEASDDQRKEGKQRKAQQQQRVLHALLSYLQIDPRYIRGGADDDGERLELCNWLEQVYERVRALVPRAVWKLYRSEAAASAEELSVLAALSASADDKSSTELLRQHRQRGLLPLAMSTLSKLIINPLSSISSFAVPCDAALAAIAECAPLIECGAGTGYWSALLQARGVDVIAFDSQPPSASSFNNGFFFHGTYCDVQHGDGRELFGGTDAATLARRALLLIWPNNPDERDNPHIRLPCRAAAEDGAGVGGLQPSLPPVWDCECLASYIRAGGRTVVFIGEREEEVNACLQADALPDCGSSASRPFQQLLCKHFELVSRVHTHTWAYNVDDLTIWTRRSGPPASYTT